MKKTLLSLMCVAAFGYANAEVVHLDCNDVDQTAIVGTYVETTYQADGTTVKAYAHWQPLESLVLGGFTFSFYAPDTYFDGEKDKNTTKPAFYTAAEGKQYTIRVYAYTEMTITAPEGSLMSGIVFNGSNAGTGLEVTPSVGGIVLDSNKLTWGNEDGVESVKFTFNASYRINTLDITLGEKGEEPVEPVVETAAFERVGNEIVSGKRYVFAIPGDNAMQVASNIDESKSYGRLALVNAELDGNANVVCPEAYAITITETSEGYTLKDEFGRFIGFDSAHPTSFQLYTEAGENTYWNLAELEDGSVEFESTLDNTAIICQAFGGDGTPYSNVAVAVAPEEYNQPILYVEVTAGVEDLAVDANAPAEFFNLQGVRVAVPTSGLYICRQGNTATKVLVK